MAIHYVYADPEKDSLWQGDVLQRTDGLLGILRPHFPTYADDDECKYFMLLTQGCDLVRRDGNSCKSPYLSIAAVRTLEYTLAIEAEQHQRSEWQKQGKIINERARDQISMFLHRLIDNNEPSYFYLHEDRSVGINQHCCALLQLSLTVSAEHYGVLLEAKVAQLQEPFQMKLGSLIGNMYNRVGTIEWNSAVKGQTLKQFVDDYLEETFVALDEKQIKEALTDLRANGRLETLPPEDIADYVIKKKVTSPATKFKEQASKTLSAALLMSPMAKPIIQAFRNNEVVKVAILGILESQGIQESPLVADQILQAVIDAMPNIVKDENFPPKGKAAFAESLVNILLSNPSVKSLLK